MRSRSNIEIRRCRPLLGTFVEVVACGRNAADLKCGIDTAFASVEKVCRLMSYHDAQSDVSRMNRDAFPKGVIVHPWTWQVMKAAKQLAEESHGTASSRDIFLRHNYEVFFRRDLIVDLGGIAKGFAVDRAVDALKENGIGCGIVNAGGDLRTFGPALQLIHLRHPTNPTRVAGAVRLRERALATSGIYFERQKYQGRHVSPLLDGRSRQTARELISVSVAAAECVTADALTKVVFALREEAAGFLAQYGADALLLGCDGAALWMFHSPCDTGERTRFD
jgi:thiamine biosynthesis lipoprotein